MIETQDSESGAPIYPLPSELVHDLRSPLNQILGYSEMLMEQALEVGQDEFVPDLQKVRDAGKNLLNLIENRFLSTHVPTSVATPAGLVPTIYQIREAQECFDKPAAGESSQGYLLVVDDNEANRDVLSRRLERQCYTVATANSGHQALDKLAAESFDLVLLDIMMPDMDGYEVLQRLKADERLQHIPVIMISALTELDSVVRCIEMGAEDYLFKPFDPTLLRARIGACLEKKRAHDREVALYEQVQQNYKRSQELEKMRDDLTHMIIHDLRTPLTSVMAGMQSLEMVGELNEDQKMIMNIALIGGETLLGMINDLLDVDKSESGSMELNYAMMKPADLVASAVNQVTSLVESEQLSINQKVPTNLPEILGDESKLRRTLVNLLGNAIKFTPSGGKVTIEVSHEPTKDEILFSVRDTGEGIPPEAFDKIFEKFGQVESRKSGRVMSTGLGLTFCKLVVEAHGGQIGVTSVPGKGSNFSFTIPLLAEAD